MFSFSENLEILGHRVTPEGRFPTQKGTEAIMSMPRSHNVSSVKRLLGMVGYFCNHVHDMATSTVHLRSLLRKGVPFNWTPSHEEEFMDLKNALTSPDTMLLHPDFTKPFEVHTDALKYGCGGMLAQYYKNELRPVKYASQSFSPTESRWPTTHQELFAVKWGLEQFRPYVLGRKIKVVTDHANLKWLTSISLKQSKLARWCISMAEFNFTIEHRPGSSLVVPDTLSRAPLYSPSTAGDCLIIPPPEVCSFLVTALGYDIPSHTPSLISQVFDNSLQCLALACDISPPAIHVDSPEMHVLPCSKNITAPNKQATPNVLSPNPP